MGSGAVEVGSQPVAGGHAPAIPRHQTREVVLPHGGAEVVADAALMVEELRSDDCADRVATEIIGAGVAAAVAEETGQRFGAARFEFTTEDVAFGHASSSSLRQHFRRLASHESPQETSRPTRECSPPTLFLVTAVWDPSRHDEAWTQLAVDSLTEPPYQLGKGRRIGRDPNRRIRIGRDPNRRGPPKAGATATITRTG